VCWVEMFQPSPTDGVVLDLQNISWRLRCRTWFVVLGIYQAAHQAAMQWPVKVLGDGNIPSQDWDRVKSLPLWEALADCVRDGGQERAGGSKGGAGTNTFASLFQMSGEERAEQEFEKNLLFAEEASRKDEDLRAWRVAEEVHARAMRQEREQRDREVAEQEQCAKMVERERAAKEENARAEQERSRPLRLRPAEMAAAMAAKIARAEEERCRGVREAGRAADFEAEQVRCAKMAEMERAAKEENARRDEQQRSRPLRLRPGEMAAAMASKIALAEKDAKVERERLAQRDAPASVSRVGQQGGEPRMVRQAELQEREDRKRAAEKVALAKRVRDEALAKTRREAARQEVASQTSRSI